MGIFAKSSQKLGLLPALAVVCGESIAIGIFLTPAGMARSLGSPLLLALIWAGMGFMALCGALCFSELALRFPRSGGEVVYLKEGFGEEVSFLYGWTGMFAMYPGLLAALAVGSRPYVAAVVNLPPAVLQLEPALVICLLGGLAMIGTRVIGSIASVTTMLKVILIPGVAFWALTSGHAHWANLMPFCARRPGSDPLIPAIAGAAVSAFFSLGGWWEAGKIAGEMRNPRRDLPIAFLGGVSVVVAIYLIVNEVFVAVVPLAQVNSGAAFVAQFGAELFGPLGATILSVLVLICVLSGVAALSMTAPRVAVAMGDKGGFLAVFARLHPRLGTPVRAIVLQTVLALVVLGLGAFDRLLAFLVFPAVLFIMATVAVLFRLPNPPRAWWYPTAPILFLLLSALVDLLLLAHNPLPALVGILAVLPGLPVYRMLVRPRPAVAERSVC